MFEQEKNHIETRIKHICSEKDYPPIDEVIWSEIPFSGEWGLSTSFFKLAAQEARSGKKVIVPQRAQEMADAIKSALGEPEGFSRIEAVKGYLNIYFETASYARRIWQTVLDQKGDYGRGKSTGRKVMVEFSQPNTHKALHIGHLRSMILGAVLSNILEYAGDEVVRANYIGDIGLDVAKWLWNYLDKHKGEEPVGDTTKWMGEIYAEAGHRLEENPELETEVRNTLVRWNNKEEEVVDLWWKSRQWSLDGFNEIYDLMGIHFDQFYFEHEVDEPGKAMVQKLIEAGIAEDERPEGPVIVKIDEKLGLDKDKYRVAVVLRSDGTALYATWDPALALKKFEDFELDRSIYVVDVRQSLHFQQVFKILELYGRKDLSEKCYHLPYEIVNLPGNVTMKSREGTVVLLDTLITEAKKRALETVNEKNPELDTRVKEEVAEMVALGAIKFPMLARDNAKIATFDWESALNFNGNSSPYIQYAHVRAASILRQNKVEVDPGIKPQYELHKAEIELIDTISQLPSAVQQAARENKTLLITTLAYDLAKTFNDFYNQCPVMKAEDHIRKCRLVLVAAAKQSIAICLKILSIHAPESM